jgi:5-methylcytosine-specific restriction protein A
VKIAKAQGRSVEEWIGKTPDSMPPRTVRLRIFERHQGKDLFSSRKIMPGDKWELCHIIALEDGGENRESNLAPGLYAAHRKETGRENSQRATERNRRMAHLNIRKAPYKPIQSAPFAKREKRPRTLTKAMPRNLSMLNGIKVQP